MDKAKRDRLARLGQTGLRDNTARYRAAGKVEGGLYTLADLLGEEHRRQKPGIFGTLETARLIVDLAAASPTGLTTYGALWAALRPGEPWRLFPARGEITNALERVQHYCLRHGMPLLATLVVNAEEGGLTEHAKANIANWARENGMAVGFDAEVFVGGQQEQARHITQAELNEKGG